MGPVILISFSRSFTINGLWPSKKSRNNYGKFSLPLLHNDSRLFESMNKNWPPQPQIGGRPYFLWEWLWKTHGSAFGDMLL